MKIEVYSECRADEGLLEDLKKQIDEDKDLELMQADENGQWEAGTDIVFVLGDRPAALKKATWCAENHIPVAHISGGETTEGVVDNYVRDAITKMSHLHFTSTEHYRQRVIRLGEHPDRVFWVGEPGLDNMPLDDDIRFLGYMVTYHPTLNDVKLNDLFDALDTLNDKIIFNAPNKDKGYEKIVARIEDFVKKHDNAEYTPTLGRKSFLSHLRYAKALIGNSSAGIVEAPSLGTPCVNIGDRQKGRIQGNNVVNCELDKESIINSLKSILRIDIPINPYYKDGKAISEILRLLKTFDIKTLLKKEFYG